MTPNVANSDYEEIEYLGVREKKTVVDDVERLFLIFDFDYKRYVGFGSTLSAGDHIYTVPAESVEQTSGYAGGITHIFADDSHCGKIVLRMYGV